MNAQTDNEINVDESKVEVNLYFKYHTTMFQLLVMFQPLVLVCSLCFKRHISLFEHNVERLYTIKENKQKMQFIRATRCRNCITVIIKICTVC